MKLKSVFKKILTTSATGLIAVSANAAGSQDCTSSSPCPRLGDVQIRIATSHLVATGTIVSGARHTPLELCFSLGRAHSSLIELVYDTNGTRNAETKKRMTLVKENFADALTFCEGKEEYFFDTKSQATLTTMDEVGVRLQNISDLFSKPLPSMTSDLNLTDKVVR